MIFCYFELRGCSREEAIHTEIVFIRAYLEKRFESRPESVKKRSKYQDSYQQSVKKRSPSGDPAVIEDSGAISSDTLMKDKGLRGGLQGLIDRFSTVSKG